MECVDQDPIEVILVFDEKTMGGRRVQTQRPVNVPPQLREALGQNYLGKNHVELASVGSLPNVNFTNLTL